jgi:hypothetical protein
MNVKRLVNFSVISILLISSLFPVSVNALGQGNTNAPPNSNLGLNSPSGKPYPPSAIDGPMAEVDSLAVISGAYEIGQPSLTDLWVDPLLGDDEHSGSSRQNALRTVSAAWDRIPAGTALASTGYRLQLVAGLYPQDFLPVYMEDRHGVYQFPVILQAADGNGTVVLGGGLNIFNCDYLYLIGFNVVPNPAGDALHFERCHHVLLRSVLLNSRGAAQETLKANQCSYLYVEECDISGSYGTALDFVSVQYGHIIHNRVHDAGDWCMYLKGGSAYFRIEGNELYNGDTGGFTAGQGTGFEFMQSPWLHYETYDIKFINNLIHDTGGAGMGVNGSYNILLAFNTLYRVGARSHAIEIVFGLRGCDGDVTRCQSNLAAGGWGTARTGIEEPIPDRNIFIYNNILYNPPGYQSQWSHFALFGPRTPSAGTNIPSPANTDANLRIRGNIFFNGPPDLSLGIGEDGQGGQPSNPTCNAELVLAQNAINTIQPQLVDPAGGDYRPIAGSNVLSYPAQAIPDFTWTDAPTRPSVPAGQLSNLVAQDRDGAPRSTPAYPGALMLRSEIENKVSTTPLLTTSVNPAVTGQTVAFSVQVNAGAPDNLTPSGTVNFMDSGSLLGTGRLDSNGQAAYTTTALPVGTHPISALYSGDSHFSSSLSSTLSQVVNKAATTVSIASSLNPAISGQTVTFNAAVQVKSPGGGLPGGTITFKDGTATLGVRTLNASGLAALQLNNLAVRTHAISAEYSATAGYGGSTSPALNQVITTAPKPVITIPATPPLGEVAGAYPAQTLSVTGGTPDYAWSWKAASGSALPPGLSLKAAKDTKTAAFSGKPTKAGTYKFTVTAKDHQGLNGTLSLSVTIYPALDIKRSGAAIALTRLPDAYTGRAYACALTASGGVGPYTWSKGTGFPDWLNIDPRTGLLSGTPTARGYILHLNIIVRDSLGYSYTKSPLLIINKSPAAARPAAVN